MLLRYVIYTVMILLGIAAICGTQGNLPRECRYVAGGILILALGLHTAQVALGVSKWTAIALAPVFAIGWFAIFEGALFLLSYFWQVIPDLKTLL